MEYLYESETADYEDYASGRVLYNARGATAFPVRLASEIAQRCFRHLESRGADGPYSLYDPCCGGGYLLTVVGLKHGRRLEAVYGSDIDPDKVSVAASNLSLLTAEGMRNREAQLKELAERYGKPSHRDALGSLARLRERLGESNIRTIKTFEADSTASGSVAGSLPGSVDIVITDLPYGNLAEWRGGSANPLEAMLDRIYGVLNAERAVVAVVADKQQKLRHDRYRRLQLIKAGKRQFALFEPIDGV